VNKTKLSYFLALAVPLAGCATAKPRSLEEAQNILASKDITSFSHERPKLVAEAKGEVKKGEDALARGNSEEAALRGHIALAKLNTARNFVERGEARTMARAISENDEATAGERARFAELEKKLAESSKGQSGAAFDGAKRAIMVARERQADAIREGAPVKAAARYDEGKRLVENAIESLSMKQNADAKRSAERATAAFDASIVLAKGAVEKAPAKDVVVAPAPRPTPPPPPARVPDAGYTGPVGDMRTLAENKIVELQLRKTELLGLLRDENCKAPFREFDATLDLAQKRLDARDYAKAFEFAVRAAERMRVCDRGASGPVSGTVGAAAAEPKADPKEALRKQAAASSLARAQEEIARAQATRDPSDPVLVQAQTLVSKAESWFEKQSYPEAESFAKQAVTVLAQAKKEAAPKPANGKEKLDPAQEARNALGEATERLARAKALGDVEESHIAVAEELLKSAEASYEKQLFESATTLAKKAKAELDAKGAKKVAGKPDPKADPKAKVEPKAKPGTDGPPDLPQEIDWKTAYDSITKAQAARDRVRGDRTATDAYKKGSEALAQAKSAYQEKSFSKANDSARAAEDAFGAAGGAQWGNEPVVDKDKPAAGGTEAGSGGKVAASGGGAGASAPADPAVAYRKVTEALTRRDRIQKFLRTSDKAAFLEAGQTLGLARGAWAEKDYARAASYATSASAKYDQIADSMKSGGVVLPGEDVVDARKAEEALREAKLALELCERGKCIDRDSATFLRGKGLVESANRTFTQGDFAYAFKLAEQGRKTLGDALAAQGPKQEDPKEIAKQQEAAEAALRETNVLAEVCKQQNCSATDMENTLRAEQLFKAAKTAMESKRYPLVKELADESRGIYRKVIDSKPKFAVPDTNKRVTLKGDQLFVEPSVQYTTGTAKLEKSSEPSVNEVADTIKKNLAAIRSIRLVGYTDNSGNAAANVKLSKSRAQALADSLAAHGVPTGLMNADGRGSENPIANNATADGKKQNRRVEIHIDFK